MPRPIVSATTEEWYGSLGRVTDDDESLGWPLLIFLEAIGMLQQAVDVIVRDDDAGNPGWSVVMDVDNAPSAGLAWLGQFVGVQTLVGLSDAANRIRIVSTGGQKRGTPASLRAAAQQYLTGTQSVTIFERETSAYHFRVRTFTAETPDPAAVAAALLADKPAGLTMTVEVAAGLSYDELGSRYADSDAMSATGATYDDLQTLT